MKLHENKILIGIDPGIKSCACGIYMNESIFTQNMPKTFELLDDFRAVKFITEVITRCGGLEKVRTYLELYLPYTITRGKLQSKQSKLNTLIVQQLGNNCRLIEAWEWKKALSRDRKRYYPKPSLLLLNHHLKERFGLTVRRKDLTRHEKDTLGLLCYGFDCDRSEGLL